jgi:hypothetical protein
VRCLLLLLDLVFEVLERMSVVRASAVVGVEQRQVLGALVVAQELGEPLDEVPVGDVDARESYAVLVKVRAIGHERTERLSWHAPRPCGKRSSNASSPRKCVVELPAAIEGGAIRCDNPMVGLFDPQLNPSAWFDESLVPEGWFDADLIGLPTLRPLLAAFLAVKPDYAHPQHDHDDLVAVATTDFLSLALVLVAVLKRFRPSATG